MVGFHERHTITAISIILIAVTFAIYFQVGNHDFLHFDDYTYIKENTHVTGGLTRSNIAWAFTSTHAANWHPVTWLSLMLDADLYGINPRGYHLTNVAIHCLAVVLLLFFLVQISGALWQSAFVAALFALHPMHVESIAWASERKDVLCAFFCFATLISYARFMEKRKLSTYMFTFVLFMFGLMSKPMLLTLPIIMIMLDLWSLKHPGCQNENLLISGTFPSTKLLLEKVPFFILSLASALLTIKSQHQGGAIVNLDVIPIGSRLENIASSYVLYIAKTFYPKGLAFFYPFPSSIPMWQIVGSLIILLFLTLGALWARRNYPFLALGWFWFVITLIPVIGFVQVGEQSMADRYTYIPHVGLFIMVAWGTPVILKNIRYRDRILAVMAGAAIMIFGSLTYMQLQYWQNDYSLCLHAIEVTTANYVAHENLGSVLVENQATLDAAIEEYKKARAIKPNNSSIHCNLGKALAMKGDMESALMECRQALALDPNNSEAYGVLGDIFMTMNDLNSAILEYRNAIEINQDNYIAHCNLGVALAKTGDMDSAVKEFRRSLSINPNYFEALNNLKYTLAHRTK